jgi:hypothetical protein
MPFVEVSGSGESAAPEHIGPTAVKVGMTKDVTVTGIVVVVDVQAPVGETT